MMRESTAAQQGHHYNLIASAVAGRSITVHWHDNSRLCAYTDGRSIYLPGDQRLMDQALTVIAQALLIRSGALRRTFIQRLVGRTLLADRYSYAEVCRAADLHWELLPRKFCEHPAIRDFPHTSISSDDSLRLAASRKAFPALPDFVGKLRTVLILRTTIPETAFAALSRKQQQGQMELANSPQLDEADEEDAQESKILKLFSNPLMSGGTLSNLLNNILGGGRSGKPEDDSSSGGGAEMEVGSTVQSKKKGVFATLTDLAIDIIAKDQADDAGSKSYPEWNYVSAAYRENWTLVDEMDPWREEPESNDVINRLLQPPSTAMKRKLAGIGLSFEVHHNQQYGEDFTVDRIVDYILDYRLGIAPDENLYSHSMKTCRDLAAMVLLDISGSTAEKDDDGQSIHHQQLQLAYHMTRALHELGDQVSFYGFPLLGKITGPSAAN